VATCHTTFYPPSFSLDLILHALGHLDATAPSTIVGCASNQGGQRASLLGLSLNLIFLSRRLFG
jgi:hypothetical protein